MLGCLLHYGHSDCIERYDNGLSPFFDSLCRNVFYCAIDYIPLLQAEEVTDAAAYIALKHEYIPLDFQLLIILEISPCNHIHIIQGQIRGASGVFWDTSRHTRSTDLKPLS